MEHLNSLNLFTLTPTKKATFDNLLHLEKKSNSAWWAPHAYPAFSASNEVGTLLIPKSTSLPLLSNPAKACFFACGEKNMALQAVSRKQDNNISFLIPKEDFLA